jgi:hypothetical protein
LLVEAIAVVGAGLGIYIAFSSAEPEIHLTEQSSAAPIEFAFYIRENSPIISVHLLQTTCVIEHAIDINNSTIDNTFSVNAIDKIIGVGNRQIYYRCPIHLGIPLIRLETSVIVEFRWYIFGFDWWSTSAKSLTFTWPAGPYDQHWREGSAVN